MLSKFEKFERVYFALAASSIAAMLRKKKKSPISTTMEVHQSSSFTSFWTINDVEALHRPSECTKCSSIQKSVC